LLGSQDSVSNQIHVKLLPNDAGFGDISC